MAIPLIVGALALMAGGYGARQHSQNLKMNAARKANEWAIDRQSDLQDERTDEQLRQVSKYGAGEYGKRRKAAQSKTTARLQELFAEAPAEPGYAADLSDAFTDNQQVLAADNALEASAIANQLGRLGGLQSNEHAMNRDTQGFNARAMRHRARAKQIENERSKELAEAGKKGRGWDVGGTAAMMVGGTLLGSGAGAAGAGAGAGAGTGGASGAGLGTAAAGAASIGASAVLNQQAEQAKTRAANRANETATEQNEQIQEKKTEEILSSIRNQRVDQRRSHREAAESQATDRVAALLEDDAGPIVAGDTSDAQLKDMARAIAAKTEVGHELARSFGRLGGVEAVESKLGRDKQRLNAQQARHAAEVARVQNRLKIALAEAQEKGGMQALLAQLAQAYGTSALVSGAGGMGGAEQMALVEDPAMAELLNPNYRMA